MTPRLCIMFAVATAVSTPACAAQGIPGLEVKAAIFTTAIDQKNYVQPGLESGVRLQHGPIFLWIILSGTEETLNALKSIAPRTLPVRHRWTYLGVAGRESDSPDVSEHDTEAIKLGKIRHWPALSAEVESEGTFAWRTWSGKRHLREGRYEVRVVSSSGETLRYNGQECVYYFDYSP